MHEVERHAAVGTQVAAVFGKRVAYVRNGAGFVVGQAVPPLKPRRRCCVALRSAIRCIPRSWKLPVPLSMARCTLSLGILFSAAFSKARRRRPDLNRGFAAAHIRAVTVISLIKQVKILPRLAS